MGWRIAHVCRTGWPVVGGMESAIHGLARAQVRAGHAVEVVTLLHAADGRGLPDVDHEGVRYRRLHRVGPKRYPFAWGLKRAVASADLVHVHGLDGFADRLARSRERPPIGVSTHGGFLHSRRQWALKQGVLRTVTRGTLAAADAVWFTSAVDKDALEPAGIAGRVVPNGVDLDDFLAVQRAPIRGLWVCVGRLDRHKGLGRLLRLVAAIGGVRLQLIGPDAGSRASLEREVAALHLEERVDFRGELGREALCEALRVAELALFPSEHESFGVAVVEAMAAGVPVVVSDIPAHRALIRHAQTGFAIDVSDSNAAAEAVSGIRDGLQGVGHAARLAAAEHGWTQRIEVWNRAYVELLERPLLARGLS